MPTWEDATPWYREMVADPTRGFNHLASDVVARLLGDCTGLHILDIGCGEGHIARRLARAGARVVGIDPTPGLLNGALEAEADEPLGVEYRHGRAEDLGSLSDASLDVVVAALVFHHVEDLQSALGQARRVLRVGGRLVVVVPHPWTDHPGARWATGAEASRRMTGDYGTEGLWSEQAAPGSTNPTSVRQIGWYHRMLATWFNAVAGAGFCVGQVMEPTGRESGRADGGGLWSDVPRFLAFSATAR